MMTWTNLWEQEGMGSPVSKLCPNCENRNWAPVRCCAEWYVKTSLWSLSAKLQQNRSLHGFLCSFVTMCVSLQVTASERRETWTHMPATSYIQLMVLGVVWSWRDKKVLFLLSEVDWRRQSFPLKVLFVLWAVSIRFIRNFDSICSAVVCAVPSYNASLLRHHKTVRPATLSTGEPLNRTRSKLDPILGIKREFLY